MPGAPPAGGGAHSPAPPQEVVALLVGSRARELDHAHVARVDWGDEALDRAALAGRVPALEDDAHGRPELLGADLAAEREPKLDQPLPREVERPRLLLPAHR